jgi:hypothetical protein
VINTLFLKFSYQLIFYNYKKEWKTLDKIKDRLLNPMSRLRVETGTFLMCTISMHHSFICNLTLRIMKIVSLKTKFSWQRLAFLSLLSSSVVSSIKILGQKNAAMTIKRPVQTLKNLKICFQKSAN